MLRIYPCKTDGTQPADNIAVHVGNSEANTSELLATYITIHIVPRENINIAPFFEIIIINKYTNYDK